MDELAWVVAKLAMLVGTRRWVILSIDMLLSARLRMLLLVRTCMGLSALGVGGIVVLRWRLGGAGMMSAGSVVGSLKCLRMGHVTEVDVCPLAALWFPWAM